MKFNERPLDSELCFTGVCEMTKSPRKIVLQFLFFAVSSGLTFINVCAQTETHSVQVASYLNTADAQAEVNRLRAKKLDAYWVKAEIPGMGTRYRVRIGKFTNENDATQGAAAACKSRAFSQYLVANGENVPTGVRAKSCKSVVTESEHAKLKTPKPETVVAKPAPTRATVAANIVKAAPVQPVVNAAPQPITAPKTKATVKPTPAVKPTPVAVAPNTTTVASPLPPKAAPKTAVTPVPTNAAKPTTVASAVEPTFVPSASPGDIVSNAYKYATTKAGRAAKAGANASTATTTNSEAPSSINSMIARATPGLTNEVAIANPKWKVSSTNVAGDKNLRAVHFVDSAKGWAAGDGGTIYQTLDGGKQWNPIRNATLAGAVVDVNRIYFINENKGWMLGETHEGEEGRTVLLSTDDGGKIWQNFEMPNVTSFYFVDNKKGWAVGRNATMLKTSDGGMKWKPIENLNRLVGLPVESAASKFGFSDVFFLKGGEVGWAVGNFYGIGTTNIGGLFMTSDGGDNWQRIPIAVQRKTNSTRFTRGKLHSVRFTDVSSGVITGEMEDGDERFFFTLKTRNGGETWEQARVPSSGIHSTQFVDSARGWTAASALRAGSADAKIYDTILLRTDNGGKSWVTDFVSKGKQIRSVFFISPTRGWAVGDRGMILRYEAKEAK
jgi:photosystem II stability/assembly factor-like uncharacterized protein